METRAKTWQPWIGPNAKPWKASPASEAEHGYSAEPGCSFRRSFENLQDMNVDEIIEEFGVTREQVEAVLQFVARSPEAEPLRP